eukprot:TRINITY_DN16995_c0_g1_i4.p1 TRINITY_DN16995_c0_g1~~TRINITY_DN16995_c0_g1_i4.p1  ORF type:complete len:263 (-),score=58.81 TRINITY_DN16995_c0_g1_i4:16-804(-)
MNTYAKIDSIPEQAITSALANLDVTKGYVKGKYVDVYDKSSWRAAVITNVTSDTVSVQYDESGSKQDHIKIGGGRIAPFRRYTRGAAGQERKPGSFKYSRAKKDTIERRLEKLLAASFTVKDPEDFVQFFRGEFFFYVDALLTRLDTSSVDYESVKDIMSFLNFCVKVAAEWIRDSWNLKAELEAAETWDLLYKVHGRTALCTAYSELAEMLNSFLGGSQQVVPLFRLLYGNSKNTLGNLSLIHICRCRRYAVCRSRWSPYP